jgi:hypothetical protein
LRRQPIGDVVDPSFARVIGLLALRAEKQVLEVANSHFRSVSRDEHAI